MYGIKLGKSLLAKFMDKSLRQTYEDEIQCLQEEICILEQKAKKTRLYSQEFLKTMHLQNEKLSMQNLESWKYSTADLETQVEQAKSQIALLTQLTGIGFGQYNMTTVSEGNNKKKKYRLSGYSYSLHFELEFELTEIQAEKNVMTTVTDLNIILELSDVCDLNRFISRTEERKSLLLFFRTISVFAKWYEYRRSTFRHFKEKYPEVVRLPEGTGGEYMVLKCYDLPGIVLKIFWKILVSEEGVVTPVLDLLTKIPTEALNFDTEKVMDSAPTTFRRLLCLHGIEAAIECLIELCKEP
ncbi:centromere protein P isoform X3 [Narcine bancroftii]|uniref:centromere protein P isoform X3 n=1 Tax=Narcine bancroftii TaxID=1343680 RepID=UPI003831979C